MASSSSFFRRAEGSPLKSSAASERPMSSWRSCEALPVDLVVEDGVAGGPLLHELGEDAGLVGVEPRPVHLGEDLLPDGLALPERDDDVLVGCPVLRADPERGLGPAVEDVEVLQAVGRDLGIGGRRLGRRSSLADDELPFPEPNGLVFEEMPEGQGPLHGRARDGVRVLPVEIRHQPGPLGRQAGLRFETRLAQSRDPIVHIYSPKRTLNPRDSKCRLISPSLSGEGADSAPVRVRLPSPRYFSRPSAW